MEQTRAMAASSPINVTTNIEMSPEIKALIASKVAPKEIDEVTGEFIPESRFAGPHIVFKHQGTVQFKVQVQYNSTSQAYDFIGLGRRESSTEIDTDRSDSEDPSNMARKKPTFNPDDVTVWGFDPRKPLIYKGMLVREFVDDSEWLEVLRTVENPNLLMEKMNNYDGLEAQLLNFSIASDPAVGTGDLPIDLTGVTFNAWTKHETAFDNVLANWKGGAEKFNEWLRTQDEREADEELQAEIEEAKEISADEALEAKAKKYAYKPDQQFKAAEAGNLMRNVVTPLPAPGPGKGPKAMRKAIPWIVWYEFRNFMLTVHNHTFNMPDPKTSRREVKRVWYDEFLVGYMKSWGIDMTGQLGLSQLFAVREDGSIRQINTDKGVGYMHRLEPVEKDGDEADADDEAE